MYFFSLCRFSGEDQTLHVRSMLGLLPLLVSVVVEDALVQKLPGFKKRLTDLLQSRPDLANQVCRYSIATTSIAAANNIVSSTYCMADIQGTFGLCSNKENFFSNSFRSLSLMELNATIYVPCHLKAVN